MELNTILTILGALVGWPALVALLVDILKWAGVVTEGTSGKWQVGFNLVGFIAVAVLVGFYPQIDIPGADAVLNQYVQLAVYVFGLLVQIVGSKFWHGAWATTRIGKKYFSFPIGVG